MYKSVKAKIKQLADEGIPEDFLMDVYEEYSIDEDGNKASATYIIRALENEADNVREYI